MKRRTKSAERGGGKTNHAFHKGEEYTEFARNEFTQGHRNDDGGGDGHATEGRIFVSDEHRMPSRAGRTSKLSFVSVLLLLPPLPPFPSLFQFITSKRALCPSVKQAGDI